MKKKIVLCGIQEQGIEIVEHLLSNNIFIAQIVTISKELAEKNSAAGWVSYEILSQKHNIPIHYLKTYGMKHEEDKRFFLEQKFDLLLLGGWQRLIPPEILETFIYGAIGQHGSSEFLPKGRGRSPLNWSLIKGKDKLIWHLFFLKPGIDDGPIIDYEIFDITPWDNCQTLYYKVSAAVRHMLTRTIPKIFDSTVMRKEQEGEPTYYPKRTPEDGLIQWNQSLIGIYNLIRAVTHPYPGAFTFANGRKVMIWKAQPWDTKLSFYYGRQNGEIIEVFSDGNYVVKCKDGLLLITESEGMDVRLGTIFRSD